MQVIFFLRETLKARFESVRGSKDSCDSSGSVHCTGWTYLAQSQADFKPSMDGAIVNNFQNDQLHQIELWVRQLALVLKGELWARRLALVLKGSMHRVLQRALQGLVSPKCAQCSTPV